MQNQTSRLARCVPLACNELHAALHRFENWRRRRRALDIRLAHSGTNIPAKSQHVQLTQACPDLLKNFKSEVKKPRLQLVQHTFVPRLDTWTDSKGTPSRQLWDGCIELMWELVVLPEGPVGLEQRTAA